MKRTVLIRPLLGVLGFLFIASAPVSPAQDNDKIILVDLDVKTPQDAPKAYSTAFDRKKVEIPLTEDDPINALEDFSIAEDPLEGPDCFMPEMKIIFSHYTYVFSLYCTSVVKYKNSAPFTPSSTKVQSDIEVTESVLQYLEGVRKKYFNVSTDPKVAAQFVKINKFEDEKIDDDDLLKDDDEQEDKELEKEAVDKEGWFDDQKDPGLEEDETPDVPEEDPQ